MGLPVQLDGLPDQLNLRNPVRCPVCRQQVEYFRREMKSPSEEIFICGSCNHEVPREYNQLIKQNRA